MKLRVWTPRRSAVHTLINITNEYRSNRSPMQSSPPVDKLGVLATPWAWRWKANYFGSTQPSFLELAGMEDLIESEVFVFGDVP